MILNLFFIAFISILNLNRFVNGLSCKDENEKNVDFAFVYKLPFVFSHTNPNDVIYTYLYKTDLDTSSTWGMSRNNIMFGPGAIPSIILKPLFDGNQRKNYNYISYNDIPPTNNFESLTIQGQSSNYGYSKVLVWHKESKTAIWILHSFASAPKLFSTEMNGFPSSEFKNSKEAKANNFLCISIKYEHIQTIIKHLIITKVKVYDKNLAKSNKLKKAQNSLYTIKTHGINKKDQSIVKQISITELKTAGDKPYLIISRHRKDSEKQFWKKVAAAVGDNGMSIKSTNLGIVSKLQSFIPSNCKNTIHDVLELKINLPKYWGLNLDDSQWAICLNKNCVCISNLDHKNFNAKETGTAVCLFDDNLHEALKNTIERLSCH